MVGIMTLPTTNTTMTTTTTTSASSSTSRDRLTSLINSVTFSSNLPSKLDNLRRLKLQLQLLPSTHEEKDEEEEENIVLLSEILPSVLRLCNDHFSPGRKSAIEIIGGIGSRHSEFLAEIVPALLLVVDDGTPAVARQAISTGTDIFCSTLEKIVIQGLQTCEWQDSLESTWAWMLKLKEKFYSIAFQPGNDGRRLLALKFVAAVILIYTPDPNGSSELPSHPVRDGKVGGFNMSWLRRGHPILKVGDLSVEASRSLGLLLDQLRLPIVKSLSTSMVVVLINCLSAIAIKRPSFYGRILPVLLGLDPSNSVMKGLHAYGVQHSLKNAYLSCMKCTHPSAAPWRDRLITALREMKSGDLEALEGLCHVNGSVKEEMVDSVVKDEQSIEAHDPVCDKTGRKRSSGQEGERNEDDDTPGKRAKSMHIVSDDLNDRSHSVETKTDSSEDDMGPVQQLVAVFAALVAQGEKAAASLEILISSISADLLADVVLANLRSLPPTRPMANIDEELPGSMALQKSETDSPFGQLSSFLLNAFSSSSSQPMSISAEINPPAADDTEVPQVEESCCMDEGDNDLAPATSTETAQIPHSDLSCALAAISASGLTKSFSAVASDFQAMESVDAGIPGLSDAPSEVPPDTVTTSSLASTYLDETSQDQVNSSGKILPSESLPSFSTEKSEELSSKAVAVDTNIGITSTATSAGPTQRFVLPKISAPVVELSDEGKDKLQKLVFVSILEAYKQVAVAGGSQLRYSLLAYLGVQFPQDLDPWTLLQTHILSDYISHEGHELTLRVLYRLYGESEEEHDFFSSANATSVYETFLLKVAETLRDSFPASDKSLSKLLNEVPHLPKSTLKLLECLCCPETGDKDDKESHSGDRVTQGLSAVWNLIMLRPTLRKLLLRIAMQSAVHHLEEVRMKAIRLVANKLYPLPALAFQIEDFAKEMLLSVVARPNSAAADTDNSSTQLQKKLDITLDCSEQATAETGSAGPSGQVVESSPPGTTSVSEAQRCMSLYFALCTKKHALLREIFLMYKSSPESVKQAVHHQMPILIRTMGASPPVLLIIADPPDESKNLLMQVLHTLTDGITPSSELICTITNLYESKIKDVEILFPILSFLAKEEVLKVFPQLVNLPQDKFQAALARLLQGSKPSGPVLTPSEVLIAIHGIDPEKDGIPLKKVIEACNSCFQQTQIFTQPDIAKVLNQLVEQIPLPLLFMRTVMQATSAFPALVDFIMDILSRLVSKQIWKYPKLWVGFLKCAQLTQPHSFNVLLQLPAAQLEAGLMKNPALKAPLAAHVNQSNTKSTLPRSVLVALGIADPQSESQSQSAPPESEDANSSDKDAVTEKSKDSSAGS